MIETWQTKIEKLLKDYLKGYSASHDFYHAKRVEGYMLKISEEIDCDKDVLIAVALIHDAGYKKHEEDIAHHEIYGAELAEKLLLEVGFSQKKIADVVEAIRLHNNYSWSENFQKTENVITKILQDADRIDAIGAIGIARLAYFFGTQQLPIYSDEPVLEDKLGRPNHSLIDQLKREVENKWKNMNFDISKQISKEKQEFMEVYYLRLKEEFDGKY